MKRFYLAYGSNLNVRQMKLRCPTERVVGTAEIKNYELLFKGSQTGSYLTIEPKKGGIVPVAVWEVQEQDVRRLDAYEGFPKFYYKKDMEIRYKGIRTGRHRTVTAFVYIMHEDREIGIPSSRYISTCIEGYNDFGFNLNILFDTVDRSIPNE